MSNEPSDKQRLDWLEKNPNVEISYENWNDDVGWIAHRVSGGKNDREWCEIAEGDTIRECIDAAMRSVSKHE